MWTAGINGQLTTRELARFGGPTVRVLPNRHDYAVAISATGRYVTYADERGAHVLDVEISIDTPIAAPYGFIGRQVTMR